MISEVSHSKAMQILSNTPVFTVSFFANFEIVADDNPASFCNSDLLMPLSIKSFHNFL